MKECTKCEANKKAYLKEMEKRSQMELKIISLKNALKEITNCLKDEHYADGWEK